MCSLCAPCVHARSIASIIQTPTEPHHHSGSFGTRLAPPAAAHELPHSHCTIRRALPDTSLEGGKGPKRPLSIMSVCFFSALCVLVCVPWAVSPQ